MHSDRETESLHYFYSYGVLNRIDFSARSDVRMLHVAKWLHIRLTIWIKVRTMKETGNLSQLFPAAKMTDAVIIALFNKNMEPSSLQS